MTTAVDINFVEKVMNANKIEDVINIDDFRASFNSVMKKIHPDVCSDTDAVKAMSRMNVWKDEFENGKSFKDDLGEFLSNGYWVKYNSDSPNLKWSFENHKKFLGLSGKADESFKRYIPSVAIFSHNDLQFNFDKRAIPLSGLTLPQEHVNWILNRLLEYSAYLAQTGFVHCGLNPESVFIVPETHGIQVCSFYHLSRLGQKMGTISGKYSHWYPKDVFDKKIATSSIDIECSKRIAAYLLGDKSGAGIKFRKTHNEDFINFILSNHTNAYQAMDTYKKLLKKNFKSEFHNLTI